MTSMAVPQFLRLVPTPIQPVLNTAWAWISLSMPYLRQPLSVQPSRLSPSWGGS